MSKNYPNSATKLAKSLAKNGIELDEMLCENHAQLVMRFSDADYFNLAIAASLTWTGHAVDKGDYYIQALKYLATGDNPTLEKASTFAGRYGEESLALGLKGWREIRLNMVVPAVSECSVERIKNFQQECLQQAERLEERNMLRGIGPWLFCGPFKIIIAHRNELWENPVIDDIMMPLGIEVVRGVKRLIKSRSPFVADIDKTMIAENEGGLAEGLGTVLLVQSVSMVIAGLVGSRVIHINSGLFLYGRNELE